MILSWKPVYHVDTPVSVVTTVSVVRSSLPIVVPSFLPHAIAVGVSVMVRHFQFLRLEDTACL